MEGQRNEKMELNIPGNGEETTEVDEKSLELATGNDSEELGETAPEVAEDCKSKRGSCTSQQVSSILKTLTSRFLLNLIHRCLILQGDIQEEINAAFNTLDELWNEIGFEPHECQSSSNDMFSEIKRVLSNKISATQEIKSALNCQMRLLSARYSP